MFYLQYCSKVEYRLHIFTFWIYVEFCLRYNACISSQIAYAVTATWIIRFHYLYPRTEKDILSIKCMMQEEEQWKKA